MQINSIMAIKKDSLINSINIDEIYLTNIYLGVY